MINIRAALNADLPGITAIYNEAILETVATFDAEPKTREEQDAWFAQHGEKNPIVQTPDGVAEINRLAAAISGIWSTS